MLLYREFFISSFFILFSYLLSAQVEPLTPEEMDNHLADCEIHLRGADFYSVLPCLEDLKPILEKSGYYDGLARYYTILVDFYMLNGNHDKMLASIEEAFLNYGKYFSDRDRMRFQLSELQILQSQNKNEEILVKAEHLLPQIKDARYRAGLYSIRASAYMDIGAYEESMRDFYEALFIFKAENDIQNVIVIYSRIGLLQQQLKKYDKALELFEKAYDYAKELADEESLGVVHTNLGSIYLDMDDADAAIANFLKAEDYTKRKENPIDQARLLLNLGDAYIYKEEYKTALEYLNRSLKISTEANIPIGMLYNYRSFGHVYTKMGDFENSIRSLDSAMKYARELKMPSLESDILVGYYNLYKSKSNYKKALDYYIQNDSLNKILLSQDTEKSIADLEIKYQTELKTQELEKIQLELDKNQAKNRSLRIGISSAVAGFGFIAFFMFYRNRNLRRLYDRNVELLQTVNYYKITPDAIDDRDQLEQLFDRLMELINVEKIYTDPFLGIKDVAEMLNTNEKYVSSAISKYGNTNYNNFINFHRINEAKELIYSDSFLSMNEIMKASGFNSRTPFYNAFKNFTGLSPTQFKNMKREVTSA